MKIIRLGLAAPLMAASLAACSGASPLESDFNLVGTEPFWAIQISNGTKMSKVSRPGSADMDAAYPVASKGEGGATILTIQSPEGDLVVTMHKKQCLDGMSDREYPWQASVAFKGQTLKGCGASKQFISEHPQ